MKKKLLLILFVLSVSFGNAEAQAAFTTMDSVNINQINASVLVHGDMWWNPALESSHCLYPNGTQKNIGFVSALWMSAYDAGNNLHVAAQTYRQDGNDYWPGPIDTGATSYATSHDWAKIWKVNRSDVDAFRANTTHDVTNTAPAIWTWPARGNVHAQGNGGVPLYITENMAPFVDLNGDDIYEPDLGEYPRFAGDQALWWVINDNGAAHSQSNGIPLGMQIEGLAYAYNRPNGIGRAVFYRYIIKNKSANHYRNFRIGQFADMDLGYSQDDFIGFDSSRALAIVYNGENSDRVYGTNMPMSGVMMLGLRTPLTAVGVSNFTYFNNDASIIGNPSTDTQFNNYLRGKFRTGTHLTDDFTAPGIPTKGYGAGPQTNFVYFGNPGDSTQWSECSSGNNPGDRRFVIATGDADLYAGDVSQLDMVLLTTTEGPNNACGDTGLSFTGIRSLADTLRSIFDSNGGITEVKDVQAKSAINIYPNPANDKLTIETAGNSSTGEIIMICNILGQMVPAAVSGGGGKYHADIRDLPQGIYYILVSNGSARTVARFVKE